MEALTIAIILFILVTIALLKSKYERHFLFFMIRTQQGIRLIDVIAKISPGFWKFIGDVSIVVSFSGLGAFYLSCKEESRRNLYVIIILASILGVFLTGAGLIAKILSVALMAACVLIMSRLNSKALNYFVTSMVVILIAGAFLAEIHFVLLVGIFGLPALIIMALIQQGYDILQGSTLPGVSPMLPATQEGNIGVTFPGYDIFIPWWYALIGIIATLVPHELAHGILSRVHKVKLKSTGLLTFGAMPVGAFVEPDEEQLKRQHSIQRTRIFAVGSLANFATGMLCVVILALMTLSLDRMIYSDGVIVLDFDKGYPAEKALEKEAVIYQLNGMNLTGIKAFEEAASTIKPGDAVTFNTSNGTRAITAAEHPTDKKRGYMGVVVSENLKIRQEAISWLVTPGLVGFLIKSLNWIIFFNLAIGLVNLMPLPPFDGYRIIEEIIKTSGMKKQDIKWAIYGIILATALIFILNLFPLIKMLINPVLKFFGF